MQNEAVGRNGPTEFVEVLGLLPLYRGDIQDEVRSPLLRGNTGRSSPATTVLGTPSDDDPAFFLAY